MLLLLLFTTVYTKNGHPYSFYFLANHFWLFGLSHILTVLIIDFTLKKINYWLYFIGIQMKKKKNVNILNANVIIK